MDKVTTVNQKVKLNLWMSRIKECQASHISIKQWCEENGLCEQTYYKWLKKIRLLAIDNNLIEIPKEEVQVAPSFISLTVPTVINDNIMITKGTIKIEINKDSNIDDVINMIKVLLC